MYPSSDPTDLWPIVLWGIIGASLFAFFLFNLIGLIRLLKEGPQKMKQNFRGHNRYWYYGYFFWATGLIAITYSFIRFAASIWELFLILAILGLMEIIIGIDIMEESKGLTIK